MISIAITSFKEPKTIGRTIESIINQRINEKYELVVAAPDDETLNAARKYKEVSIFKDPGKGKSFALNLLFKKLKGNILIFTDGDLYLGENSVNELLKLFNDKKIGIVSGRPVSDDDKNTMMGYWAHLLLDAGAHNIRKKLFSERKFLECTGYLFAFRKGIIDKIPLDVAEDSYIPYIFWKKGYKIGYAEDAIVYLKYPDNFKDWIKQKTRTSKAHETLQNYAPDFPRVKSFSNEVLYGVFWALSYPKKIKEFFWTLTLFFARFYMWILVVIDTKFKKKNYSDGWERVESTK